MLELFVLMLAGETIWRLSLLIANLQKLQPRLLKDAGIKVPKRVVFYQTALGMWQLFGLLYQRFLFVGLILSGFFFWYNELLSKLHLPLPLQGLIYLMSLELGGVLLNFPLYLYRRLLLEERFGFNKESLSSVLKDKFIEGLLTMFILVPLLLLLLTVMNVSPFWWIYGYIGLLFFQGVLFWLYPLLIAPLFNKFRPLEEGALKQRLENLLQQCRFPCRGLFVMDGSKRSAHSNAYFTGLGNGRRIVLYDTLIEQLNEEELAAVLAHEVGHYRCRHIPVNFLMLGVGLFLLFLAGSWFLQQQWFFIALGFQEAQAHLLILIAAWLLPLQQYIIQPFMLWLSRRQEYQADRFAAQCLRGSASLRKALSKLSEQNYSHPAPHPFYVAFHYSHPPLNQRLQALESIELQPL